MSGSINADDVAKLFEFYRQLNKMTYHKSVQDVLMDEAEITFTSKKGYRVGMLTYNRNDGWAVSVEEYGCGTDN